MAARASGSQVAADMRPADFRGAVQRLRGIKAKKERIAGVNGEIADIYAKVEGLKVNKKAARIFLTLDPLEADERADILRSLFGMIDVAEWDRGDLVDEAEGGTGNIVAPDFSRGKAAPAGENAAGEDNAIATAMDEIDNMPAEEQAAPLSPTAKRAQQARERAKAHFGEGKAPPPSDQEDREEYTGDNTDLAGGE